MKTIGTFLKHGLLLLVIGVGLNAPAVAQTAEEDALRALSHEAQPEKKAHYSGGMLLFQPGYTLASNDLQDIKASSMAIGGILRVYLGKCITTGIYGASQKTTYPTTNSINSYFNLGYGGPFLGISRQSGNYRYTFSAFAGMGSIKNLHIENQSNETLAEAYLYQHSVFVYSPILSLDYALTKKVSLTFQALCLMGTYGSGRRLFNPTMQAGILFNR